MIEKEVPSMMRVCGVPSTKYARIKNMFIRITSCFIHGAPAHMGAGQAVDR